MHAREPNLEPLAIIGIGCRFPKADGPDEFWTLLREGRDAITEVPPDRWDVAAYYSPTPNTPRKMITRWGGFLENVDRFDAAFFRISPREAARMDPQQRLLLEVAWEAFEDAGQVPKSLAGSATGVFIGLSASDYSRRQAAPSESDPYMPTGNAASIAANRISYFFDLQGPSFVVDTACSSALVALHQACRSIWNRESTMALAGGVNVILSPTNTINFSQAGMMSPDGRCKAFDASANGYVRGEGAGIVVLKPVSRAEADGDRVYALIRGSAVNSDGHTSSLTVPSQHAQERVTREACERAGVEPGEIDYVEAHGTGTSVGDPIEARALGRVLALGRDADRTCLIGSCKTNIGHTESAAGIAGIIKVALSLAHEEIPPSLHFHTPNPSIPFDELPLEVHTALSPWPARPRPWLAGVNSFGFGGTNAHVVLEQYTGPQPRHRHSPGTDPTALRVFPLSAESPEALSGLVSAHAQTLTAPGDGAADSLDDICYTAGVRRVHHEHRVAVVARTREELADGLQAFVAGEARLGLSQGQARTESPTKLAFVFPGQGSQWWAMGRGLLERHPVFRRTVEECDALFRRKAAWSLVDELMADEAHSRLHETAVAQPALFALEVGLAAVFRSFEIVPDAVVGHSLGEAAAAYVAGALSLGDAIDVVFHRSRLMQHATGKGKMAAVELSLDEAQLALRGYEHAVSIAAANSPSSVVLSGDPTALEAILTRLQDRDVFYRYLPVNYAFHSHQMEPYLEELERALGGMSPTLPSIAMYSTVLGEPLTNSHRLDASYWVKNVRRTVRFVTALDALIAGGHTLFLELGPHPTLAGVINQTLKKRGAHGTFVPSLRRGEDDEAVVLGAVGTLYTSGLEVDWRPLCSKTAGCVGLPRYAWNRERHWLESNGDAAGWEPTAPTSALRAHPLLARRLDVAQATWRVDVASARLAYLRDHRVQGSALLPGAAFIEMGLAAGAEALGTPRSAVTEAEFHKPLLLPDDGDILVEVAVTPESEGSGAFQVLSRPVSVDAEHESAWVLHASGRVHAAADTSARSEPDMVRHVGKRFPTEVSVEELYDRLAANGLQYGPSFRGISAIWRGDREALAQVSVPPDLQHDVSLYVVHPALLDACFQVLAATAGESASGRSDLYLPTGVRRVHVLTTPGATVWCHARLVSHTAQSDGSLEADLLVMDDSGAVCVEVAGLRLQRIEDGARLQSSDRLAERFYEMAWELEMRPGQLAEAPSPETLPDPHTLRAPLEARLTRLVAHKGLHRVDFDTLERWGDAQVLTALRRLGWVPRVGEQCSPDRLEAELGIVASQHRLFRRLLERLETACVLERCEDGYVVRALPGDDPRVLFREMLASCPNTWLDLELQARCGDRLADVLTGTFDPLQLLFPDGSLADAERFYQDSAFASIFSELMQQVVSTAVDGCAPGTRLRILEIGAGTGGSTAYILPALPAGRFDYVYTDVSPIFTAHGAQKFASIPSCRYQPLDIERDPLQQGFSAQSFDVVIASNVLHATSDLNQALANIKTVLADRGLLLLGELAGPTALYDMVFALTEGWWRFRDTALRSSYPLLSQERWVRLLTDVGFSDVVTVGDDERLRTKQTLLLARGPLVPTIPTLEPFPQPNADDRTSWVVCARESAVDRSLIDALRARGDRCLEVTIGAQYTETDDDRVQVNPSSPEDFMRLAGRLRGDATPWRHAIYLWGLDGASTISVEALGPALDLCVGGALHLAQALASSDGPTPRLWFLTQGAAPLAHDATAPSSVAQASLWGLARVLGNEHPELRCTVVDLGWGLTSGAISSLIDELSVDDGEREVALRGGSRFVHRARPYSSLRHAGHTRATPDPAFRLEVSKPGMLDSVVLREVDRREPGPGEVGVAVSASGLNFLDVLSALGLRPDQPARGAVTEIGMECVGTVTTIGSGVDHVHVGDEVMVVTPYSLSNYVVARAPFVVRKPPNLSVEEAATVPVAFLTAYYALHHLGRIRRGERILIHAAAGGVGLAAVQLAQRAGADVFATAGSPAKRAYLRAIGVPYVMDSRSLAFAEEIRALTHGAGVDLVLNSLAGEAIPASMSLLKPNGRFLEIGKKDIYQNAKLGLGALRGNRAFHAIDLIPLFIEQPEFSGEMLRAVMSMLEAGDISPLPYRAFPITDAELGFRYMAQAKQIGKVVLTRESQPVAVAGARQSALSLPSDATYLVTGGLGGFGLLVAEWLVERGARHLVLMGRRGASSESAVHAVRQMQAAGVRVEVATADVADTASVTAVVRRVSTDMPPLRGVFHAAMVLDDAAVLQLTLERFRRVMAPKTLGGWNLHHATLDQPLDYFVLFGSVAALVGSPGQANYVAANATLDALAHYRRGLGLRATVIDWGRLGGVGYVARHQAIGDRLDAIGIKAMPPSEALAALERVLIEQPVQVAVVDADWRLTHGAIDSRLFARLFPEQGAASTSSVEHSLRTALLATDASQRHSLIVAYIQAELSRVLRMDASRLDPAKRLTSLGLDSLMAYELKARIESDLGVGLPMVKLVGGPSIAELADYLVTQVDASSPPTALASPTPPRLHVQVQPPTGDDQITSQLEQLSEDQLDSLLSGFTPEEREAARERLS